MSAVRLLTCALYLAMNADTARHRNTLSKLTDAFDELEDALEPLLSKPLAETATGLPGPLDRAKLNALVPYMVHDLLFSTSCLLREFQV